MAIICDHGDGYDAYAEDDGNTGHERGVLLAVKENRIDFMRS